MPKKTPMRVLRADLDISYHEMSRITGIAHETIRRLEHGQGITRKTWRSLRRSLRRDLERLGLSGTDFLEGRVG